MAKTRINWTIKTATLNLLKNISQQQKKSISQLVEHAINQTYQDQFQIALEKIQYHGEQLETWKEELKRIKKKRKNEQLGG